MRMHPITMAAQEFISDELRRQRRGQRVRMDDRDMIELGHAVAAIASPVTPEGVDSPHYRRTRGELAVRVFAYADTFSEQAATVITDILHAAHANGYDPQSVLDTAATYYAEERDDDR